MAKAKVEEVKPDEVSEEVVRAEEVKPVVSKSEAKRVAAMQEESSNKIEAVNVIFEGLEKTLLHGSAEQMNAQANELLSAKIKIKRLF